MRERGTPSDADVAMERYASGDDSSFGQVYDTVAPRIYAYLRRRVRDPARAEDLVQQTMLHMHRARGTFIAGSPVLPWAFAIARRLLLDGIRHDRRDVLATADSVTDAVHVGVPDDQAESMVQARETALRVQQELARLPEAQRTAFELARLDGLSHAEVAETVGATVTAVKIRVHRAYVALRGILAEEDDPESSGG